jgi:3-dehydroquinate synthase/shikimate kinase/3-dehydroquinate synthase
LIVLIGFMGAGKTTIGRALAQRLGLPFVDVDDVIADETGRSIPEIFAIEGEAGFRAMERAATIEILGGDDAVVALGGGALGDPDTRAALDGAEVVYLRADLDEHLRRVQTGAGRPMLAARSPEELLAERVPLY